MLPNVVARTLFPQLWAWGSGGRDRDTSPPRPPGLGQRWRPLTRDAEGGHPRTVSFWLRFFPRPRGAAKARGTATFEPPLPQRQAGPAHSRGLPRLHSEETGRRRGCRPPSLRAVGGELAGGSHADCRPQLAHPSSVAVPPPKHKCTSIDCAVHFSDQGATG